MRGRQNGWLGRKQQVGLTLAGTAHNETQLERRYTTPERGDETTRKMETLDASGTIFHVQGRSRPFRERDVHHYKLYSLYSLYIKRILTYSYSLSLINIKA